MEHDDAPCSFRSLDVLDETENEIDSESERENDLQWSSAKKQKLHRAVAYSTKFDPAWKTKFPCVQPVKKDAFSFMCIVCSNKVISCKRQGVKDVKRHIEGPIQMQERSEYLV